MNKLCSIYLDGSGPVDDKIINYLKNKYDSIFLVGREVTTKYHSDIPYLYYNYIRYMTNIDIVFQNLTDIETLGLAKHNIYYIYDASKHNKNYNIVSDMFAKLDSVLLIDKNISQQLLQDVFKFSKEIIYV